MPITDPTDIANLELWLDADQLVLSDGDPVSTWDDWSGNNRDATQTGASRPTYKTGIVPTSNKPVVRFDGFDGSSISMNLPNAFTALTAGEVFVVCKVDNDPPAAQAQSGPPIKLGTAASADHYPFTDSNVYFGAMSNARKSTGNPSTSLATWHFLNVISTSSEWTLNINGSQHFTTATNTVAFTSSPIVGLFTSAQKFDGDIAEVILFSRKLSGTERTDVLDYLDTKYNTAGGGGTVSPNLLHSNLLQSHLLTGLAR